ncbi:MAG: 50S ribosomal protein L23 [Planctomycetes bacterium]|jgi:large subunit ribosomal protein L23|nr:50S ribosomal protein L23 [Planctomycetota bacterium]MCP4837824.1 50S ribosomal protein L23 [Planctomycetota bacterium]
MRSTDVIRRPIVTEKSTWEASEHNRYAFEVDRTAAKPDVRAAVQELYGVRVLEVAIQNRKGQMRRNKFGYWKTNDIKRAIVKIHPEDKIELI